MIVRQCEWTVQMDFRTEEMYERFITYQTSFALCLALYQAVCQTDG